MSRLQKYEDAPQELGGVEEGAMARRGVLPTSEITLLGILWRRKFAAALCLLISMLLAVGYLFKTTPIYSSSARVCIEQNTPQLLGERENDRTDTTGTFLYTQAEVVNSMPVLMSALEKPGVANARVFKPGENKATYLRKHLGVDVGKKDNIISVSFDSPDPREAATIVNAVVDSYLDFESFRNHSTAGEMLKVLTVEKEKHEAMLKEQEQAMLEFKQANGDAFFQTDKGNIVMQDMATVSSELMQARLQEAQARAAYETANDIALARTAWQQAQNRVANFEQIYREQQNKAMALNAKMAQYQNLQSDIERTMRISDLLDSRIKQLSVTEGAGPLNISVLEPGRVEDKPSSPRLLLTLAVGFMGGLVAGACAALGRETMDGRLRSAEEVTEYLGLPVLAVVPTIPAGETPVSGVHITSSPHSHASEAYRSFRAALQYGTSSRENRTILITSPLPGEGKSTTASNLAIALAQSGRKTLLIDADLRHPVQHTNFDLAGLRGICDVLLHDSNPDDVIQKTAVENLDLLAAGRLPADRPDLLNSHAFQEMLETLAEEYDQVIVDSPPVLPVADARILGALCDVTLLVLRAEQSTRKASRLTCDLLFNVRAKVIGAVFNDLPANRDSTKLYYRGQNHFYSSNGHHKPVATPALPQDVGRHGG